MYLNLNQRFWLAVAIGVGLAVVLSYICALIILASGIELTAIINGAIIGYAIKKYARRPDHKVGLVAVFSTFLSVFLTSFAVIVITTGNPLLYFSPNVWLFVLSDFISLFSVHGFMSLVWLLFGLYISYRIVLE